MNASNGDAESVDAFLERIASSKDKTETGDAESRRKLEQDILQGRRERQARRLERARSISPKKNAPNPMSSSTADSHHSSPTHRLAMDSPVVLPPSSSPPRMREPRPASPIQASRQAGFSRPLPPPPTNSSDGNSATESAVGLTRKNTLSWQQRPTGASRVSPLHSRPLSRGSDSTAPAISNESLSRDHIAQNLSSKDPSWFRQTPDRGAHSSAYRKDSEKSYPDGGHGSRQLHSMQPRPKAETHNPPENASVENPISSTPVATNTSPGQRIPQDALPVGPRIGREKPRSPSPNKTSPEFDVGTQKTRVNNSLTDGLVSIPAHSQPQQERPSSPTKGLGGFVQSAMMKRSDSINKRWSVQAAPGLSRGDSIATARGAHGHRPSNAARPISISNYEAKPVPQSSSPPRSSQGSRPISNQNSNGSEFRLNTPPQSPSREIHPQDQSPSLGKRSGAVAGLPPETSESTSPILKPTAAPSVSPSKTLDPRRWSPTKASWLESALTRPESPTKPSPPVAQIPSWMADLQRSASVKNNSTPVKDGGAGPRPTPVAPLSKSPVTMNPSPSSNHNPLPDRDRPRHNSQASLRKEEDISSRGTEVLRKDATNKPGSPRGRESHPLRLPDRDSPVEIQSGAQRPEIVNDVAVGEGKRQPPVLKPKPESPKTDFRATLKPRKNLLQGNAKAEPEFKNVFGNLKRTETKNYVAPDVFKDNIMRGKAALSLTGGPQTTKRVDEFKESILKKKEDMKVNPRITQESERASVGSAKPAALPEAMAKRNNLQKHSPPSKAPSGDPLMVGATRPGPAALERVQPRSPLKVLDQVSPRNQESSVAERTSHKPSMEKPSRTDELTASRTEVEPSLHRETGRQIETNVVKYGQPVDQGISQASAAEPSISTKGNTIVSKLANRLNPNLGSILSRGPAPTTAGQDSRADESNVTRDSNSTSSVLHGNESASGELTHMTKARAKGPKRRLPKAEMVPTAIQNRPASDNAPRDSDLPLRKYQTLPAAEQNSSSGTVSQKTGSVQSSHQSPPRSSRVKSPDSNEVEPSKGLLAPLHSPNRRKVKLWSEQSPAEVKTDEKPKPVIASKSPLVRKISPQGPDSVTEPSPKVTSTRVVSPEPKSKPGALRSPPELANSKPNVGSPELQTEAGKPEVAQGRDVLRSPPRSDIRKKPEAISPLLTGLGLRLAQESTQPAAAQMTPPPEHEFHEEPKSGHLAFLTDFFSEAPRLSEKGEIDVQSSIVRKIRTENKNKVLKAKVWQIHADGKKENLPLEQQHILYEDSIYLCIAEFASSKDAPGVTNAYLWSGDVVSEAATEDAQLFARREARENQAKLELLSQGKEHVKFFEALGGIVITRRSRRTQYTLCGRRHLGHIAFDEVDLATSGLFSEFVYIMRTTIGKLYLWKGSRSGADEIGCARLIGMDLGLTGDVEEVDEGKEPRAFFAAVEGVSQSQRPTPERRATTPVRQTDLHCRLFHIEMERSKGLSSFWTMRPSSPAKLIKGTANEIYPFCQRDLDRRGIYVLDTLSHLFVYVGSEAESKAAEFVTALAFAEQYGILAVSLEDRSSIPPCLVSFSNPSPPPSFTAAFRKWESSPEPKGLGSEGSRLIYLADVLASLE